MHVGPEFPRRGRSAVFALDVLGFAGSSGALLEASVEHRHPEDAVWTRLASFPPVRGTVRSVVAASEIREVLRFRVALSGAADPATLEFRLGAADWRP